MTPKAHATTRRPSPTPARTQSVHAGSWASLFIGGTVKPLDNRAYEQARDGRGEEEMM